MRISPDARARLVSIGCCAALLCAAAEAQSLLYEKTGPSGSYFGSEVAGAGDLDGDGKRDFLVADWISSAGYAQAFSGADGTVLHTWTGAGGTSFFARGMTGDVDVDGDGLSDVILGRRDSSAGALFAYSGLSGSQLWTVNLAMPTDIVSLTDRDADGRRDIAVLRNSGAILEVRSGATGALIWSDPAVQANALANAGDFNQDGVEDLLVAGSGNLPRVLSGVDGAVLFTIPEAVQTYADTIDGAGDVNGDGFADVVLAGFPDTSVRVYGGPSGQLLHTFINPDADISDGYYWGAAVCAAGDADLDGFDDVAVRSGLIGIYVYSGQDGERLSLFEDDSREGWRMAATGDVNGDGFPDILSGNEEGGTNPGGGPGYAQVISPCPLPPQTYCTALPNSTGVATSIGSLGTASLTAADLRLTAVGGVPGQSALFFYGPERADLPFGHGRMCVGGGAFGYFRMGPPQAFDGAGRLVRDVALSGGTGDPTAGDLAVGLHWNFQLWYRDPAAGGSGFNLSNALSVTPCP